MVGLVRPAAALFFLLLAGPSSGFSVHQSRRYHRPSTGRAPSSQLLASSTNDPPPSEESASFDMNDLRKRMERQESQYAQLLLEQSAYAENEREVPESVHIILFQPGTERQHVHTVEYPMGSGNNLILAFEGGGDCVDFARMLRDLEFADPCPEETMFEPFRQYCEMSGMSLMIVPKGFELTPPQINANDDIDDGDEDGELLVDDDTTIQSDLAGNGVDEDLDAWG